MSFHQSALFVHLVAVGLLTASSAVLAVETPAEDCSTSKVVADATHKVFSSSDVNPLFVQDETSSQAAMSTPAEADWLNYVEMHERYSGAAARSVFMPWFSLQHEAN